MTNPFFEKPILNSPYGYPARYWELDKTGQPTQQIIEKRRPAEFITPIPKPKANGCAAAKSSSTSHIDFNTQTESWETSEKACQLMGFQDVNEN